MQHDFDQGYWDAHWRGVDPGGVLPPNPYLVREAGCLLPGTVLEAGCGEGAEAIWLAGAGWKVTAVDIARDALSRAEARAAAASLDDGALTWVQADLSTWAPSERFDLVTSHYAHPAMPQLDFYVRLSEWVAPGGSLLVVGHLHGAGGGVQHVPSDGHGHGNGPPVEATATAASITARLDAAQWHVVTAEEASRRVDTPDRRQVTLRDVVVRAVKARE